MSYICEKCEIHLDSEWCDKCDIIVPCTCELQYGRIKDFSIGEKGRTTKIEYNYCDDCGFFDIISFGN